jgi:3-oxoacyl-[acyl-carrier protein] reductase
MRELQGKVAVVTGASKGIGAAIAKELAAAGAAVVVNYATSRDGADKVVAEITRKDGRAIAVQGDMSKRADVQRLFAETTKAFGRLDVLVNNAASSASSRSRSHRGRVPPPLRHERARPDPGDAGGREALRPRWRQRHQHQLGRGPQRDAELGGLLGTKSALDTVSRILAKELGPRKIRVNSLSPGYTVTEGVVSAGINESEMAKEMVAQTPLGRAGRPEDIATGSRCSWPSDRSAWITGEVLPVSGGLW